MTDANINTPETPTDVLTVTPTEMTGSHHMLTMDVAKKMSAKELIKLLNMDSDKNNPFSFKSCCEFSRGFVTDRLQKVHGYNYFTGWFTDAQIGVIKNMIEISNTSCVGNLKDEPVILHIGQQKCECERRLLTIPKDISDRWTIFNSGILNKSVILGYALDRFMKDCENDRVRLVVKLTDHGS